MKRTDACDEICAFDLETTGTDVENDRILTCYSVVQDYKGNIVREASWVIDPGVEVPEGAAAVHGMSTEWVREHGRKDVAEAIAEIERWLETANDQRLPIVGFNHSFDLAMLDFEIGRHLNGTLNLPTARYFDPAVYDRAMDKYRKGKRKLSDVARHYGIVLDESRLHEAKYDVELTAELTWILFKASPFTLNQLQNLQPKWKKAWAEHLTEYWAEQGITNEDGSPQVATGNFPW